MSAQHPTWSSQWCTRGSRSRRAMAFVFGSVLALLTLPAVAGTAPTVLFVGNSFTAGMQSPVWRYRASSVNDIHHDDVGGVPALFKLFTIEAGLTYQVSVETVPGETLKYHYTHEKKGIDRHWDYVILQEFSTLSPADPGNPATFQKYTVLLARMFASKNPGVKIWLMSPWSRPDLTYKQSSPWFGRTIETMGNDLYEAYSKVAHSTSLVTGVVPVGLAFNRAIADGVANADPYKPLDPNKINLWAYDNHHASAYGYYLEALMDFGEIAKADPRELGTDEKAGADLGLSPTQVAVLQKIAYQQLHGGSTP